MTPYCGIDLHRNNSQVSLIDEEGRLVGEKRLANDLDSITGYLGHYQDELAGVVVEPTPFSCFSFISTNSPCRHRET